MNNPIAYWDPTGHAYTKEALSEADRSLSAADQQAILDAKNAYDAATTNKQREAAHAAAEAVRARAGYSGGEDGSAYYPIENPENRIDELVDLDKERETNPGYWNSGTDGGPSSITLTSVNGQVKLIEGVDYYILNGSAYLYNNVDSRFLIDLTTNRKGIGEIEKKFVDRLEETGMSNELPNVLTSGMIGATNNTPFKTSQDLVFNVYASLTTSNLTIDDDGNLSIRENRTSLADLLNIPYNSSTSAFSNNSAAYLGSDGRYHYVDSSYGPPPPVTNNADDPVWPVGSDAWSITSEYGWREHPISGDQKFHSGIDIGGKRAPLPAGTPIVAAASGTVVFITAPFSTYNGGSDSDGYGNYMIVQSIVNGETVYMLYGHLWEINVSKNQNILAGQQIGTAGTTGGSTGVHLHFEVRKTQWGASINPWPYLP